MLCHLPSPALLGVTLACLLTYLQAYVGSALLRRLRTECMPAAPATQGPDACGADRVLSGRPPCDAGWTALGGSDSPHGPRPQAPQRSLTAATGNEKTPPWISGRVPNGRNSLMAGKSDGQISAPRWVQHGQVHMTQHAPTRLISGQTSTRRDLFPAHFERNFDSPDTFGVAHRHTLTHCDVACSMKRQSGHLIFCSDSYLTLVGYGP